MGADRMAGRKLLTLGIVCAGAFLLTHPALAQSSIGFGAPETGSGAPPTGSGPIMAVSKWIFAEQQAFYRRLTDALRSVAGEPAAAWGLVAISFIYGVFHAAGPGHGKAVISSYMLANEVALRRGIALSVVSSMLQALTAVAIISAVFLFLRGATFGQEEAILLLEIGSYGLLTAFGTWLLLRKSRTLVAALPLFNRARRRPASLSAAAVPPGGVDHAHHEGDAHHGHHACSHHSHDHAHSHAHHHDDGHDHSTCDGHHHDHTHHHHDHGTVCASCGHAHMPDPSMIGGERLAFREAIAAILAVGLRPCSGALIVLTFAFLNGLYVAGIASVFAMAIGTALTVSVLACLAVGAKGVAMRFAGGRGTRLSAIVQNGIEIGGALCVTLLGAALLTGALSTLG